MSYLTSIIILSYNNLEYTRLCLDSIRRFTEAGTYELIVIDNASTDGSVEYLKAQPDVKCIFNAENQGFPKGCNQGMEIATGTELMLLNNDVIVTPRWLDQLRLALYSSVKVGCVGCVTNNCSNFQAIGAEYTSLEGLYSWADEYNHSDPRQWERRLNLVGFCYMFKREVYEKLGGLDEDFTPGNFEDDDYSLRIQQAGWKLLLCKDTYIHHFGGGSFLKRKKGTQEISEEKRKAYAELIERNYKIFCGKWPINEDYKSGPWNMTNTVDEVVQTGDHVLFVGDGYLGRFAFLLAGSKHAVCDLALSSEWEKDFIGDAFPVFLGALDETLEKRIPGKYQHIIYLEDLMKHDISASESLLNALLNKLEPEGRLWFRAETSVFQAGPGQKIELQ